MQVSRSIEIDVPVEFFFKVVCDFERYPDFLPEIKQTKVLKKTEDEIEVFYQLSLIKKVEYTIILKPKPYSEISWELKESNLMKKNQGKWVLEPIGENRTRATYFIDVELKLMVPKIIASKLIEVSLPNMLENFKERAEKLYT